MRQKLYIRKAQEKLSEKMNFKKLLGPKMRLLKKLSVLASQNLKSFWFPLREEVFDETFILTKFKRIRKRLRTQIETTTQKRYLET